MFEDDAGKNRPGFHGRLGELMMVRIAGPASLAAGAMSIRRMHAALSKMLMAEVVA
jgi:hypothetical protein